MNIMRVARTGIEIRRALLLAIIGEEVTNLEMNLERIAKKKNSISLSVNTRILNMNKSLPSHHLSEIGVTAIVIETVTETESAAIETEKKNESGNRNVSI